MRSGRCAPRYELSMRSRDFSHEVERSFGVDSLAVRVGVDTGMVVLGPVGGGSRIEYGATGDAVNVAARLQAAAPTNGVLAGGETRRVAERHFAWGDRQALKLKGKSDEAPAYLVNGALAPTRQETETALVGRETELAVAAEAIAAVAAGAGRSSSSRGEPGIGKSRFVDEIRPDGRPTAVARGPLRLIRRVDAVLAVSRSASRVAWRRSRRPRTAHAPGASTLRLNASPATRPAICSPTSGSCSASRPIPSRAIDRRSFRQKRSNTGRSRSYAPVRVARLDGAGGRRARGRALGRSDVTPADRAAAPSDGGRGCSARDHATPRPGSSVVGTARNSRPAGCPIARASSSSQALSDDAERELLRALVGTETLPPDLEQRLLEQAEGNPFFLEELVRSLVDAGALQRENGRWRFDHETAIDIPPDGREGDSRPRRPP